MSYQATVYHVMISAPGDCEKECTKAREVINTWNASNAPHREVMLLPIDWKNNTVPEAGTPGQASINKQIVHSADMLVAIFKSRMGTPTDKYPSGTVEEVEEVVMARKPAIIYFSIADIPRNNRTDPQLCKLEDFKEASKGKHYYGDYENEDDFEKKFREHLNITVNKLILKQPTNNHNTPSEGISLDELESKLIQALQNAPGEYLICDKPEEDLFQVWIGREPLYPQVKDRAFRIQLRGSVEHLVKNKLIEPVGDQGKAFRITKAGLAFQKKKN